MSTSAAELVCGNMDSVKEIFRKARKYAPTILFIDEIDAIAKQRIGASNTARLETMLNNLLIEMDGFKKNTNILSCLE